VRYGDRALKDGRLVTTEPIEALSHDRLIALMVGRPLLALFPPRAEAADVGLAALEVRADDRTRRHACRLALRRGEIVGLGGLEGQGQREIVRALAGVIHPAGSDVVRRDRQGQEQRYDPREGALRAVGRGIGLVPEDRKQEGLYPTCRSRTTSDWACCEVWD
jgi:ribose transport system ATP-binding protein